MEEFLGNGLSASAIDPVIQLAGGGYLITGSALCLAGLQGPVLVLSVGFYLSAEFVRYVKTIRVHREEYGFLAVEDRGGLFGRAVALVQSSYTLEERQILGPLMRRLYETSRIVQDSLPDREGVKDMLLYLPDGYTSLDSILRRLGSNVANLLAAKDRQNEYLVVPESRKALVSLLIQEKEIMACVYSLTNNQLVGNSRSMSATVPGSRVADWRTLSSNPELALIFDRDQASNYTAMVIAKSYQKLSDSMPEGEFLQLPAHLNNPEVRTSTTDVADYLKMRIDFERSSGLSSSEVLGDGLDRDFQSAMIWKSTNVLNEKIGGSVIDPHPFRDGPRYHSVHPHQKTRIHRGEGQSAAGPAEHPHNHGRRSPHRALLESAEGRQSLEDGVQDGVESRLC